MSLQEIKQFAKSVLFQNIQVVDPISKRDEIADVLIEDGKLTKIGKNLKAETVIDGKGLVLSPGLIDLQVHFRDPGFEHKETLETGIDAAIQGGFVACVSMPNTKPPCDNAQVVEHQMQKAMRLGFNLFPSGALTQQREGKKISEMAEMKKAGAVAVTDDGGWLQDSGVARRAYEYAATHDLVVMTHAEDHALSSSGVMNEGLTSTKLGLRGKPNASEDVATARDIELARLTGCHLHVLHLSTAGAVEMVRRAKADGLKVTSEVTPHHILLTDEALEGYDTNFKMCPPLRSESDRRAVIEGLSDGTIDAVSTDHAPHATEEKEREIESAPDGVLGLETSFAVSSTVLVHGEKWPVSKLIEKLSTNPSEIIGQKHLGRLIEGAMANLTIFDPEEEWVFGPEHVKSKSKNSCFYGQKLKGRVKYTVVNGQLYDLEKN